jgi:hypothetical protein
MKSLTFDANLNLKSSPNELTVYGSIFTDRVDDIIIIEKGVPPAIIETVLILKLSVIEGKEPVKGNAKPFVYNLNDHSSKHYTNVTIIYGKEASKTQIVKIFG